MKNRFILYQILSIGILTIGFMACNNTNRLEEMHNGPQYFGNPLITGIATNEESDLIINMPTQKSCVWFDDKGEVIGILF